MGQDRKTASDPNDEPAPQEVEHLWLGGTVVGTNRAHACAHGQPRGLPGLLEADLPPVARLQDLALCGPSRMAQGY